MPHGSPRSPPDGGERRIRAFHPHWKRLVVPLLALLLIVAAAVAAMFLMPSFPYEGYARARWR
nr:hypothetical protein GCM10020093_091840 [Planobispora longispora]